MMSWPPLSSRGAPTRSGPVTRGSASPSRVTRTRSQSASLASATATSASPPGNQASSSVAEAYKPQQSKLSSHPRSNSYTLNFYIVPIYPSKDRTNCRIRNGKYFRNFRNSHASFFHFEYFRYVVLF